MSRRAPCSDPQQKLPILLLQHPLNICRLLSGWSLSLFARTRTHSAPMPLAWCGAASSPTNSDLAQVSCTCTGGLDIEAQKEAFPGTQTLLGVASLVQRLANRLTHNLCWSCVTTSGVFTDLWDVEIIYTKKTATVVSSQNQHLLTTFVGQLWRWGVGGAGSPEAVFPRARARSHAHGHMQHDLIASTDHIIEKCEVMCGTFTDGPVLLSSCPLPSVWFSHILGRVNFIPNRPHDLVHWIMALGGERVHVCPVWATELAARQVPAIHIHSLHLLFWLLLITDGGFLSLWKTRTTSALLYDGLHHLTTPWVQLQPAGFI